MHIPASAGWVRGVLVEPQRLQWGAGEPRITSRADLGSGFEAPLTPAAYLLATNSRSSEIGLGGKATLDGWVYALRELGDRPVAQILLTHFHPDHVGAAADLAELTAPGAIVQGANDLRSAERAFGDRRDPVGYNGGERLDKSLSVQENSRS